MAQDLHLALKTEKIASASVEGVNLVLAKLQWTKNAVGFSVHATTGSSNIVNFLTYLGFKEGTCAFVSGGNGYCRMVQDNFNLGSFSEALVESYKTLKNAEDHLHACGFHLKRSWQYDKPPRNLNIQEYAGDGHTAFRSDLMKNSEDQYFSFAFSWIEGLKVQGWTTHYRPKHPPLSSEMLAVLSFLGLKRCEECSMFDFEPCYWKFIPYEQKGASVLDNNAETAYAWFDAHATKFSQGLQRLLTVKALMEPHGIYFLPLGHDQNEMAKQEISRKIQRAKAPLVKAGRDYEYDVALSFAGTERHLAERLANIVRDAGLSVFYDDFFPEQLWGKDLVVFFDEIFRNKSRYCVIFISKEYHDRMWTNQERRSAQARALQEKGNEYILPIRVDESELPGLPSTLGYLSISQFSIQSIAEILMKKLSS